MLCHHRLEIYCNAMFIAAIMLKLGENRLIIITRCLSTQYEYYITCVMCI